MEIFYTYLPIFVGITVFFFILFDIYTPGDGLLSSRDLSRDYKRWNDSELLVAAYVAIFIEDKVRLNPNFELSIIRLLKRSDRSVTEKFRRLATIGAPKSDASKKDKETVFGLAQLEVNEAQDLFLNALKVLGANVKEVEYIKSYL